MMTQDMLLFYCLLNAYQVQKHHGVPVLLSVVYCLLNAYQVQKHLHHPDSR